MSETMNFYEDNSTLLKLEKALFIIEKSISANDDKDIILLCELLKNISIFEGSEVVFLEAKKITGYSSVRLITDGKDMSWLYQYMDSKNVGDDQFLNTMMKYCKPVFWDNAWFDHINNNYYYKSLEKTEVLESSQGVIFPFNIGKIKNRYLLFFFRYNSTDKEIKTTLNKNILIYLNKLLRFPCEAITRVCIREWDIENYSLTKREGQILDWAVKGKTSGEIALILSITERTVKFHFSNIYQKLDVINRQQAITKVMYYKSHP